MAFHGLHDWNFYLHRTILSLPIVQKPEKMAQEGWGAPPERFQMTFFAAGLSVA